MSRSTLTLLLSCAVVLVCIGSYLIYTQRALTLVDLSTMPYEEKTPYWEERIRDVGADRAYKEFKASLGSLPPVEQHWDVHIFGNALYRVGGLEAITTCDAEHDYACFHAFMISGIEEFGTDTADRLYDVCIDIFGKNAFSCLHGLGHALVAGLGYTHEDLSRALEICDKNPDPNPAMLLYGCLNGAIMEFNTPMTISGYTPREFSDTDAFEPCDSMANRTHKIACTYTQLYWWFSSLKHEEYSDRLRHVGTLCRSMNADDSELYQICIQGAGNAMDSSIEYDPSITAEACSLIDPDPEMRVLCQRFAAFRFTRYFPLEKALLACDGLPDTQAQECRDTVRTQTKTYYAEKNR